MSVELRRSVSKSAQRLGEPMNCRVLFSPTKGVGAPSSTSRFLLLIGGRLVCSGFVLCRVDTTPCDHAAPWLCCAVAVRPAWATRACVCSPHPGLFSATPAATSGSPPVHALAAPSAAHHKAVFATLHRPLVHTPSSPSRARRQAPRSRVGAHAKLAGRRAGRPALGSRGALI